MTAARVFGIGTASMWATTIALTSERFPAGGSFAIGTVAAEFIRQDHGTLEGRHAE